MGYSEDFSIVIDAVLEAIDKSGLTEDAYVAKFEELASKENDSTKKSSTLYEGLVFNTPTLEAINARTYGRIASYLASEYAEVGCITAEGTDIWVAQKRFQKPPRRIDDDGDYIITDGEYQVFELTGTFFEIFKMGKTLKEGLTKVAKFRAKAGSEVSGIKVGKPEKAPTAYNGQKRTEFVYPLDFIKPDGTIYTPTATDKRGL